MTDETTTQAVVVPDWLYWLSLVLLFVAPCQFSYAVDVKHGPFIAYVDVLACLVVGLWLLRVLMLGQWRSLVWAPRHVWALIAVAIISGLGAESLKSAALEIIQFVLYFAAVYMLFTNALNTDARRRTAVRVLLLATTMVVLYGLFQYVTSADLTAVKSTFGSRGAYSGFLTIALPLFFGLVLFSEVVWEKYWAGAVVLLGALTIVLPPLAWILALILVAMAISWCRGRVVPAVIGCVAIFMLLTVTLLPLNKAAFVELANPYEEGPIFKTMGGDENQGNKPDQPIVKKRWIEWMPALTMLAQNFVLGIGTGNYQLSIGQPEYYGFLPNVHKSEADTNNLFLVTAGTMGFAGLVCLLAFMGHFWQNTGNLWEFGQTPWGRALTCGLWGMALAIPCANLFTSTFVRGTALVWAFGYALIGG
ncbi:MAG: hypothetical protein WCP21_24295, partial [Armatimonadota bacterium]